MAAFYAAHSSIIWGVLIALGICGSLIAMAVSMGAMHQEELDLRKQVDDLTKDKENVK